MFEPLLTKEDAIVSDSLNHASIIDGVRLCKAARYRYANNDMAELEERLKEARANGARNIIIVTDGVFSMDGYVAQIDKICDLADAYEAMVMVDECHATGFIGKTGRGSIELRNALGRVDIITGTLGKAMGGAMGGFTTGKREIIDMLRQRSRPYLFSNSLAPEHRRCLHRGVQDAGRNHGIARHPRREHRVFQGRLAQGGPPLQRRRIGHCTGDAWRRQTLPSHGQCPA